MAVLALAVSLIAPLLAAAGSLAFRESWRRSRLALNAAAAVATAAAVGALTVRAAGGTPAGVRAEILPGVVMGLRADLAGALFATMTSVLWVVTAVYAHGYMRNRQSQGRFFGFFALAIFSALGVAFAADMLTLFVFFEVLSLATYPLVTHDGSPEARSAGARYLVYALGGGTALLLGVAGLRAIAPGESFVAGGHLAAAGTAVPALRAVFALLVAGFGVKAALVPLHGWLPRAMVAPAPVSALLHAVAVVKSGVFGIVRVVHFVYGPDLAARIGGTPVLAAVAAVTVLFGAAMAITRDDLKARLAYSTISQLSYIVLGLSLPNAVALAGALGHIVHHGVMKIVLFFWAGALYEELKVKRVSQLDGTARRMPLTTLAAVSAALGLAGIPPLAGFVTKWLMGKGATTAGSAWATLVYAGAGALAVAYAWPLVTRPFRRPDAERPRRDRFEGDPWLVVPVAVAAVLALALAATAGADAMPLDIAGRVAFDVFWRGR
ncbi:MAG: proton-conducting transporter membrane subunit [Anaerosomatales bacterium]|nr:proton-conducting transporter membrane subunit [Anaerosomatales bacterium]